MRGRRVIIQGGVMVTTERYAWEGSKTLADKLHSLRMGVRYTRLMGMSIFRKGLTADQIVNRV